MNYGLRTVAVDLSHPVTYDTLPLGIYVKENIVTHVRLRSFCNLTGALSSCSSATS